MLKVEKSEIFRFLGKYLYGDTQRVLLNMNKSEISKNYNIDKIVTAKELASLSRTYQDNLDTIIVMMKRKESKPDVLGQILNEIKGIKNRLTRIEERLGKHESLFKTHGWIL